MKFCSIVGARPNFIKLAPISKEIRKKYEEVIIHTGQHYDEKMSDVFFKDLKIPSPDYNLNIQETTHGNQIGKMIMGIENILLKENPDVVIVFGDTNSTLAGAISASKLHIPIAHIESGCRSFDMSMPEEQNRIMVDHISKLLYASTSTSARRLQEESVYGDIYDYGDVIVDILSSINIKPISSKDHVLVTIHRPINVDNPLYTKKILSVLNNIDNVIFSVHPRTDKMLNAHNFKSKYTNINYIPPMDYHTMISHIKSAKMVITDSGGIQKESYMLKTPCITIRNTTEWMETVSVGWNKLVTPSELSIDIIEKFKKPSAYVDIFGSVGVSKRIISSIGSYFNEGITN